MREFIQDTNHIRACFVIKDSLQKRINNNMNELTQVLSLIFAVYVKEDFLTLQIKIHMRRGTQVKRFLAIFVNKHSLEITIETYMRRNVTSSRLDMLLSSAMLAKPSIRERILSITEQCQSIFSNQERIMREFT